MTALLNAVSITAAAANQLGPVLQTPRGGVPNNALIQGRLTYGSGGLTIDAWVQTSLDGGSTWCDVCNFHFTTAAARTVFNLSSTSVISTPLAVTDGTLTANTANAGLVGPMWRVKYSSTGTYGGNTLLDVDIETTGVLTQ